VSFAETFLGLIANTPAPAGLFNPWAERNADDTAASGPFERRLRLEYHLSAPEVRFIAVGEAPGYQGARISGIPFTSEALLLDGAIPRVSAQHRLSQRVRPWSEPSARILWELLYRYGMAEFTVLWNACPYHPFADTPLSNRAPSMAEVRLGLPMLECLRDSHPQARFLAIGNKASDALTKLGIAHTPMRHPAYGGKSELEQQLEKLHRETA
jgi:uracil-DNA glycosylase